MSPYAINVTEADFEEKIIAASAHTPVVIDFWAEWCGPCRVLKPLLERLAEEYQGKFILAKVDSDENMRLSGRFGVRGIPTVVGIVGGEEKARFSGAQPENQVRAFLDRLIPSPADALRQTALEVHQRGDTTMALKILDDALALAPDNADVRIAAAEILLRSGDAGAARAMLDALPAAQRGDERVAMLLTRIAFAEKGQTLPGADALAARVQADEHDLAARLQLADAYIAQERFEPALAQLLEVVRRDPGFNDGAARQSMVSVFNLLGGSGELVGRYRRLLASALH
ncbi:MAG TPA: co-chaperone YbbN [Betaproteobacteria bacterium]|nr:co-chaperone YbbN [Betaproteobacteria bacterium]